MIPLGLERDALHPLHASPSTAPRSSMSAPRLDLSTGRIAYAPVALASTTEHVRVHQFAAVSQDRVTLDT